MKRSYWLMAASLVGGAVTALAFTAAHADATGAAPAATIAVTGHADEQVQPDEAVVSAGIVTRADTAESAQTANDTTMNKLLGVLAAARIPSSDIHTTWYTIHPDYGSPDKNGQPTMSGFEADDSIDITIHDLKNVGNIVDLLVKNGSNQINNVSYQISDPLKLQQQLRDGALADAKSQAADIAKTMGLQIVGVQSVDTTNTNGGPVPVAYGNSAAFSSAGASTSAAVSPGTQDVSTDVRVVFSVSTATNGH